MKKIILALLSVVVLFGFVGHVSADDEKSVSISPVFDTSKIPTKITVGETGQFSAPFIGDKLEGYDLEITTIFFVEDSGILKVSEDGSFQALKEGTVELSLTYQVPQSSHNKYPDVGFVFFDIARGPITIQVVAEEPVAISTPPVVGKDLPPTTEPAPTPAPVTTTAPAPKAPAGAVAHTAYRRPKPTSSVLCAGLLTSGMLVLSAFIMKKKSQN